MSPPTPALPASRRALLRGLLACAVPLRPWPAQAQASLRLLVPAPAGGTTDLIARTLAEQMRAGGGVPVVVDNRAGGAGAIAAAALLAAPANGGTLLLTPNSLVTEVPHTVATRYDPFRDFEPLVEIASSALVLVVHPSVPADSVPALVAWVKARPEPVNFASFGAGTLSHIKGLQFSKATGIAMQHVPYNGSPPALQDLAGGHVSVMFDGIATSLPQVRAGRIRALAVTSPRRSPLLPDVPALAELGFGELTQAIAITLFAAAGTPARALAQRRAQALAALQSAELVATLRAAGLDPPDQQPPETLRQQLRSEYDRAGDILRAVGQARP